MSLRPCMTLLLLLAAHTAWAQSNKGLPDPGATITLKPTPSGYEAGITIARDAKYTDAKISTTDPTLAKILTQRVDTEELPATPAPPLANTPPGDPPKPPAAPKRYVKLVTVTLTSGAIRQGNYPLTLIVTGDADPQVRDLTLVVPTARIDAPDTLVVILDRWRWSHALSANQPQIWETTQRGWLTNLSLDQKGNTDADGRPAGRIMPKGQLKNIPPGSSGLIELDQQYSLMGDFPLGTAKGKLVLQADQFADPVTFGFEVRSRIWVCWLFLPMAIGLALGAVTRKVLADRLQLNQERENAYALITLIDRARVRNADTTFQADTATIRQATEDGANKKAAAEVKNDTTTQQTAFQTALDALARRRGELDKEIAALLAIVRGYYGLPTALATAVRQTKDALEGGLPGLAANNVGAASTDLAGIRDNLRNVAKAAGNEWVEKTAHIGPGLDVLVSLQPSAVADLKTHWTTGYNAAAAAVQQLLDDTTGSPDKVQAVLQTLHVAANALHNVTTNVAAVIRAAAAGWAKILAGAELPKPTDWQDWLQHADELAAAIEATGSTDPGDIVGQIEDAAAQLLGGLKKALEQQVADPGRKQELHGLLEAGKLNEAVTAVAAANPPPPPAAHPEGRMAGAGPEAAGAQAAGAVFSVVQFSPAPSTLPAGTIGFTTPPRADITPVDVLAAAAQGNVRRTSLLLSLIYAALIAGAGYFLFADKWIGVPLDFALVFFWAYATDIGADAATAAGKGVKRP
jgi:hypothetical protein